MGLQAGSKGSKGCSSDALGECSYVARVEAYRTQCGASVQRPVSCRHTWDIS